MRWERGREEWGRRGRGEEGGREVEGLTILSLHSVHGCLEWYVN